jgi:hypothetical protein
MEPKESLRHGQGKQRRQLGAGLCQGTEESQLSCASGLDEAASEGLAEAGGPIPWNVGYGHLRITDLKPFNEDASGLFRSIVVAAQPGKGSVSTAREQLCEEKALFVMTVSLDGEIRENWKHLRAHTIREKRVLFDNPRKGAAIHSYKEEMLEGQTSRGGRVHDSDPASIPRVVWCGNAPRGVLKE